MPPSRIAEALRATTAASCDASLRKTALPEDSDLRV